MRARTKFRNIAIIGTGRVGSNLAWRFFEKGFAVVCLIDVELERAQKLAQQVKCSCVSAHLDDLPEATEIIFITTGDSLIETVCRKLSGLPLSFENKLVLHCSGALDAGVLDAVSQKGAFVASMHPVQTFVPIELGLTKLAGIYWGIEGEPAALELVKALVQDFDGKFFKIPTDKKNLYHAACVVASNYLVALEQVSAMLFGQLGVPVDLSATILAPLQEATLKNVQKSGPGTALTGPIARGDLSTVARHLEIIRDQIPEILKIYVELGRVLLPLCKQSKKLDAAMIHNFEQLFEKFEKQ